MQDVKKKLMKKLIIFLLSIVFLLLSIALLIYLAFKFEVFKVNVDFEPENIKSLNITQSDLDSINLIPVTSLKLKEVILEKNSEEKPLIFSLWASHCKPCIREFKIMDSLKIFTNEKLNLVILNADPIDESRINTVKRILYSNNMKFDSYQIKTDEKFRLFISEKILTKYISTAFTDYEIGFPFTKIWDSKNKVKYSKVGLDEEKLINYLNELN